MSRVSVQYLRMLMISGALVALVAAGAFAVPSQQAAGPVTPRPGAGVSVHLPAPPPKFALPRVDDLHVMPGQLPAGVRLLATPRARLTVHPYTADPTELVRGSGRRGCSFAFRSIAAGIIEFLFPSNGLFQRGEPLFRLYDPAVLQDLAAAEKAMQNGDVSPLLIARAAARAGLLPPPRGMRAAVAGAMIVPPGPGDFPAPTGRLSVPRLLRGSSETVTHAMPEPTPRRGGSAAAAAPARRATIQQSAPAERAASRDTSGDVPAAAKVDLGPYEDAVSQAKSAVAAAEDELGVCDEDYDAKARLVELGALAASAQEAAADKLTRARSRKQDAEARLKMAQERLGSEKERADRVAEAARRAGQMAREAQPEDVQVIRGQRGAPEATNVEVVRGNPSSGVASRQVEVHRGSAPPGEQRGSTGRQVRSSGGRPVAPPPLPPQLARGPRRFAFQEPSQPSGPDYRTGDLMTRTFSGSQQDLKRLSDLRWTEYQAPADGYVMQQATGNGSLVQPGQELLKVINTQWARAYFTVEREDAGKFVTGTLVTVTFDDYPDVLLEGWVNSLTGAGDGKSLRAEVIVFCREGYYGTDAFATLQWLALATPLQESGDDVEPVRPVDNRSPGDRYHSDPRGPMSLVPQDIWALAQNDRDDARSDTLFEGQLQLADLPQTLAPGQSGTPEQKRLAKLKNWRSGFTEGMTRTLFRDDVVLTYPRDGEIRRAIERMATSQVTHVPNRCARTVREALGWGLGDAHEWAYELPGRGYNARQDGFARPGDILVWPFTYPPNGSQHIGIAVQQNGRLMLLSNLNGTLGTVPIQPGYVAFFNPRDVSGT